jgi:hypothetical protein
MASLGFAAWPVQELLSDRTSEARLREAPEHPLELVRLPRQERSARTT